MLTYTPKRRYLVRFDAKRVPHMFADVLIIGAGIAGVRAALAMDPRLRVILVSKEEIDLSNSAWAQGGIAGVLDPEDAISNHAADTILAGAGMCDERVVQAVVEAAPDLIGELVEYGAQFDTIDGKIALTREGGHSHRRIVHALGDATGKEVMRALIASVRGVSTLDIWERTFTIDLLTHENACRGAIVWNPHHGKTFVWAKQTILCTGGAGQLYRETTNPDIATADGHAIAFRAGAELRDMEMMQFHPTVLYIAGSSRHLISEAVRGEGAYLVDAAGHRFMADYDDRLELAPRDIVSRAITSQMNKTRHPCVYLDLRHLDPSLVEERFPHINQVCREFGLDLPRDLIPVRPGAHYMIGGLTVDLEGRTTLPDLWAAGEVTSSGLHGANRLASNSLLEGLSFGRAAGRAASEAALRIPDNFTVLPIASGWPDAGVQPLGCTEEDESGSATATVTQAKAWTPTTEELNLTDLSNSLSAIMWRNVGIRRDADGLASAARQVEFWDRYVSAREFNVVDGWELQNMLLVARLMIESAQQRRESRGVHYRSDFPEPDDAQAEHISIVAGT